MKNLNNKHSNNILIPNKNISFISVTKYMGLNRWENIKASNIIKPIMIENAVQAIKNMAEKIC